VPTRRVRELAEELARELERDGALDAETRDALAELRGEVESALEEDAPASPPSARAHGFVERFERDHPELTALVQRLADALQAAGL